MNKTLNAYQLLSKYPFGNRIFSKIITFVAPYFSTIKPLIIDLSPGSCTIKMKERRAVRNHIGSVHAIALCNLCELTMLAVDVSMPSHLRWIAKKMSIQYLKKAKGTLMGKCIFKTDILMRGDVDIPIEIIDEKNDIVAKAAITVYISERPAK